MKANEQYFPVVLFLTLYNVALTFESVDESVDIQNNSYLVVVFCGVVWCGVVSVVSGSPEGDELTEVCSTKAVPHLITVSRRFFDLFVRGYKWLQDIRKSLT